MLTALFILSCRTKSDKRKSPVTVRRLLLRKHFMSLEQAEMLTVFGDTLSNTQMTFKGQPGGPHTLAHSD